MNTLNDSGIWKVIASLDDYLPSGQVLIYLAIAVLLSNIVLLVLTKSQRETLYRRVSSWAPAVARGRRISSANTPPRSLTPEKKVPNNAPPPAEYKDCFPPSSREVLLKVAESLSASQRKKIGALEINREAFTKNVIPFEADYRKCGPSTYTPMEISMAEIEALGDFPDYSKLTGVPLPEAYKEFEIEKAQARPYRPFRWPYHQTMSLNKLEPDWWLELESNYVARVAERKELFEKHGKLVLNYLPGSELACKEMMENALQFLCARYPQYFSLTQSKSKGYVFHNAILHNETVIRDMHPLHVLLENVPEDFAVMSRSPEDGMYYFRAGLLCSSLGWNVDTKLGKQLKEIHSPIPDYKAKMEFSMDRYFSRLLPDKPIQRGSWGLEIDKPLFMPPGDPHENFRSLQLSNLPLSRIHLRVDWQTLRRLPLSGAIVFNFKALFTPVEEFRNEAYVPALVLKVLKDGRRPLMEYKNTWHVEHVVVPNLEEWAREQEEEGVTQKDWDVHTLVESPWFPGWEEKWHRQQGF
ncbi:hypothetical protein IMSHALPRED_006736 [Imshaugia aleurites]|uniref:Uncharacterized protein n=1 Tax=Imshaugia aleurites TaxID=172621 RepID=A0A8H3FKW5_9LECA|nr:hypothetical protein IMSHALPRED_006736 [Imshaugia aleurites]